MSNHERMHLVRESYRAYETADHELIERLVEAEGEVFVTYEATRADGTRFRNTEIFGFEGERITRIEVYFGFDLD